MRERKPVKPEKAEEIEEESPPRRFQGDQRGKEGQEDEQGKARQTVAVA
jgi:hypothetical protein